MDNSPGLRIVPPTGMDDDWDMLEFARDRPTHRDGRQFRSYFDVADEEGGG